MDNIQLRGHCQCCGNLQAVPNGRLSKHGYTVKHHWFEGVCHGAGEAPIEKTRHVTDKVIADVRAEVAELEQRAADLRSGKIDPVWVKRTRVTENGRLRHVDVEVKKEELQEWEQDELRKGAAYRCDYRARDGKAFADYLLSVARAYHGKDLVKVERNAPAARVVKGDKKVNENGLVLTARYQEGARVFYTYEGKEGRILNSWVGTQAWRKLIDA